MRKRAYIILTLALAFFLCGCKAAQEEPYDQGAVRLHIVANSDSPYDQQLKLSLRDEILAQYAPVLSALEDSAAVWSELEALTPAIEASAQEYLEKQGADYTAEIRMGIYDFPRRSYMGEVWPQGKYRAVKLVLGQGAGQNWWCVLYPPLCFISEDDAKQAGEYYAQVEQYLSGEGELPSAHVRLWIADKMGFSAGWDEMLAKWSAAYLRIMGKEK